MRGRAVWTLLIGASVLLVSGLSSAQCSKDTDCKGDRVCNAGKCTAPVVLPPAPPAPPGSEAPTGASPASAPGSTAGAQSGAPPSAEQPRAPVLAGPEAARPLPRGTPADATASLDQDEPQVRRRNRPAMVAGIVMGSVGPLALIAALVAKSNQDSCDATLQREYPDRRLPPSERYRVDACNGYSVPVYLFGIAGGLLTVVGVPLIIYGAKSVPESPARASLRVLPWAVPGSGGVRLQLSM